MAFFEAVLTLAGMIIGVGMFAIPSSFAAAGFWVGSAELLLLTLVVLALHLLYGEIVLATSNFHRMPGYIRRYLGPNAAVVSWASSLFGAVGALLAYLIVGSLFLHTIIARVAPGATPRGLAAALALIVALITFFPLKKESAINSLLTIFEISFIAGLVLFLLHRVSFVNLALSQPTGIRNAFMPYGVLLFALSGASVIPDIITILGRDKTKARAAIIVGSLIPAVLYFFFAFAVVGVTGLRTSSEAISGLERALGGSVAWWASIAGLLAVFTSYVALSANMQAMLRLDLRLPHGSAWLTVSVVPFVLYLAGLQNFIAIIGIVGIFAFGVDGILFFFMGRAARDQQHVRNWFVSLAGYAILAVIIAGVIAELVRIF